MIAESALTAAVDTGELDLVGYIRPGDTVTWGQAGAEPLALTRALMAQRHAIGGRFRVFLGVAWSDTVHPEYADTIDFCGYCGTGANRALVNAGLLDILPCHYSTFPELLARGEMKIDVLLLQVAPPGPDGKYSLSVAHEYLLPLLSSARVVIAEVNDQAPWTYGECSLDGSELDAVVHTSRPLLNILHAAPSNVELTIARHVAALIDDGATLQFGLGALPEAILSQLADHRDLGVHSGTIGDTVADLVECGVITNARKSVDSGLTVTGMLMGTRRIYDFAHLNESICFRSTAYTHNADVLAGIDHFVALNSAIEVDLTGQINAEVAGGRYIGAVGGALDFLRGARRSKGGLPMIALPSRAGSSHPVSRIVAQLGGPVSTPRSDAGVIVTEFGVADLRGLTLRQRVKRMIDIAHPDYRESLERSAPV